MPKEKTSTKAPLVRSLVRATGMSRHGIYKCMRENRRPTNPVARKAWDRTVAAAEAKLAKAAS